jgi:malonyl CoA-acyl carrier protein transacylase
MEGQLTTSVRWTASIQYMINQGVISFVEIGSKNVLTGLIRRISKAVETQNVGAPDDVKALLESAAV